MSVHLRKFFVLLVVLSQLLAPTMILAQEEPPIVWEDLDLAKVSEATAAIPESDHFMKDWEPSMAEAPVSMETASMATDQQACYWAVVLDETLKGDTVNLQRVESQTAYSGTQVFKRSDTTSSGSHIHLEEYFGDGEAISQVFIRYWFRANRTDAGSINSSATTGSTNKSTSVTQGSFSGNWQMRESVFAWNEVRGMKLDFNVSIASNGPDSLIELDQVGIGYCLGNSIDPSDPPIYQPAEVQQLYVSAFLFAGKPFNHGGPLSAVLSPDGLKSYGLLCEQNCAYIAMTRRFGIRGNPMGVTEGIYLGDELWGSKNPGESLIIRNAISRSRQTSHDGIIRAISKYEARLASQLQTGAKPQAIEYTRFMIAWSKDKLSYFDELAAVGKETWFNVPVNYVFEMRESELSRTFDQGRYQFVKDGFMSWRRLRGIEFPEGTDQEVMRQAYKEIVRRGAPPTIKMVIGSETMRISFWTRWTGYLRDWGIPRIMATGGSLWSTLLVNARVGIAGLVEYLPSTGLYAGSALVGDALGSSAVYLMAEESALSYEEFMMSESLTSYLLVGFDVLPMTHSSLVGAQWSTAEFCIPQTRKIMKDYNYNLIVMDHPNQCSPMGWRIMQVVPDVGLILQKDNGVEIGVPYEGSSTYSMVNMDPSRGMVMVDFTLTVNRYPSNSNGDVELGINFSGFRTPEEIGLCPGWLPPDRAAGFGREECWTLPVRANLPIIIK
ncbi:MAG: hypothetical protein QG570_320 [Patescibacteria group bacterium]|nr:hypothetical protein [Patescibacteria group bacterium]